MKSSLNFSGITGLFILLLNTANSKRGNLQSIHLEQIAEKKTARMVKRLDLDRTQTAKVQVINLTYAKKIHEACEANKGNRDAKKKIYRVLQKEKKKEIKLVLSVEQFIASEENENQRQESW